MTILRWLFIYKQMACNEIINPTVCSICGNILYLFIFIVYENSLISAYLNLCYVTTSPPPAETYNILLDRHINISNYNGFFVKFLIVHILNISYYDHFTSRFYNTVNWISHPDVLWSHLVLMRIHPMLRIRIPSISKSGLSSWSRSKIWPRSNSWPRSGSRPGSGSWPRFQTQIMFLVQIRFQTIIWFLAQVRFQAKV